MHSFATGTLEIIMQINEANAQVGDFKTLFFRDNKFF